MVRYAPQCSGVRVPGGPQSVIVLRVWGSNIMLRLDQ
jgi:hypothetical protein